MILSRTKHFFSLAFIVSMLSLPACQSPNSAPDTKYLRDFHNEFFENEVSMLQSDDLYLFVDYSTCIKLGQHSSFFQSLEPSIVNASKHYFSIKGSQIQEEQAIDIYQELRNIIEVNYADLQRAANMMAAGNSEAVLLTDGEYYQKNIAKGNINNPYMADALKTWLKKGHDIFILTEPYQETNHGQIYNKKRLYFIFTDTRLQNNFYNRICQTVNLSNFPEVELFHLSADHPTVMAAGQSLETNPILASNVNPCGLFEIQEWSIDWKSIQNFIISAIDPQTAMPLPNGDKIIGGLRVDRNSYGGFRIKDIKVETYDINANYFMYYNEKDYPSGQPLTIFQLTPSPNSIIIDKEEFDKHGIVNLFFDAQYWNPSFLSGNPYNYTKVDIKVAKCENVIDYYSHKFDFDAIGLPGQTNTSVTESVKQCLFDPEIQQMMNSATLYTIYIKSNKY